MVVYVLSVSFLLYKKDGAFFNVAISYKQIHRRTSMAVRLQELAMRWAGTVCSPSHHPVSMH